MLFREPRQVKGGSGVQMSYGFRAGRVNAFAISLSAGTALEVRGFFEPLSGAVFAQFEWYRGYCHSSQFLFGMGGIFYFVNYRKGEK